MRNSFCMIHLIGHFLLTSIQWMLQVVFMALSVLTRSHNKHNLNYINYLCGRIYLCKTSGDLIVLSNWNFNTELQQIISTSKSTSGKWEDNMCTYQHISCLSRLLNLLYQGQLALLNINAELCIIWGFSYSEISELQVKISIKAHTINYRLRSDPNSCSI